MQIIDFILHIDQHLLSFINEYHGWIYLLLFAVIFVETGLVVMPLLPGDSLLFAVGMFSAQQDVAINVVPALGVMLAAAILGDFCNYMIGKYVGERILQWKVFGRPVVKPVYLQKTHAFYEKYGSLTIVIARFVPFARTIAPFVAGVGHMNGRVFVMWNVLGGFLWVLGVGLAGYFLGNVPWVQHNFEKIIPLIILVSLLPVIVGAWREWRASKRAAVID